MVVNIKNTNTSFIERTNSVNQYFSEVRKFDTLSIAEEKDLFNIIKNSSNKTLKEKAIQRIIECNQKFVIAVARHYAPSDKFLDCVSEGTIGLYNAIEMFDINAGVKFITFAAYYVKREITQYLRDEDPSIKKTNISKTYHTTAQAINYFIQKENREPTPLELVEILNEKYGIEIKDLNDLTEMRIISIDDTVNEQSDDAESCVGDLSEFNTFSASKNEYENIETKDYTKALLSNLLDVLTPREKDIITMFFGIGYERCYEANEIAEKLSLTPERVRQLKKSIIDKLQKECTEKSKLI